MITLSAVERLFAVGDETVHALRNINLNIDAGEYISIMGPSGSGKSTLLNILGLLDSPSAGSYVFDGIDTTRLSAREQANIRLRKIGFVFQYFYLVARLTAAENIELPLTLAGVAPVERRRRATAILEDLDLTARAQHRPDQLSGGQRQRVAIARATIMQPQLILADEPTGNLDRKSGIDVIETLELLNRGGMTLLVVTHDPALGERASRQIKMTDGEISADIRLPTLAKTVSATI